MNICVSDEDLLDEASHSVKVEFLKGYIKMWDDSDMEDTSHLESFYDHMCSVLGLPSECAEQVLHDLIT